jgi:hypothetical protein
MTAQWKTLTCIAVVAAIAMTPAPGGAQTPNGSATPKYEPDVPAKITTPDPVETRIGTLHFTDGTPDATTVQLADDQLDFARGVDAFVKGMSATSVRALCAGFEEAGIKLNQGFGITEDLMDARSLFLTANTTTVYVVLCIDVSAGPMVVRVPQRVGSVPRQPLEFDRRHQRVMKMYPIDRISLKKDFNLPIPAPFGIQSWRIWSSAAGGFRT